LQTAEYFDPTGYTVHELELREYPLIIIQNAEKKSGQTLTFWEFAKIRVPLTIINVAVYWAFLLLF
jgi:hypothetical protein